MYMMEYYSAMRKENILPFATRMEAEHIIVSEIRQGKVMDTTQEPKKSNVQKERESKIVVTKGPEGGVGGITLVAFKGQACNQYKMSHRD